MDQIKAFKQGFDIIKKSVQAKDYKDAKEFLEEFIPFCQNLDFTEIKNWGQIKNLMKNLLGHLAIALEQVSLALEDKHDLKVLARTMFEASNDVNRIYALSK